MKQRYVPLTEAPRHDESDWNFRSDLSQQNRSKFGEPINRNKTVLIFPSGWFILPFCLGGSVIWFFVIRWAISWF